MARICVLDRIDVTEAQRERLIALAGSADNITFYNHLENPSSIEEITRRIGNAEYVLTSWTDFPSDVIVRLPSAVKLISVVATSYAWVDIKKAHERNVAVCNVPGYARYSVAELVFAFMLDWARKIRLADVSMHEGKYDRNPFLGVELFQKTLGVVGLGSIGCRVAAIGNALGMRVLATTQQPGDDRAKAHGVTFVDLNTLFANSDVISVHVPFSGSTKNLIGKEQFAGVKRGAFFVYTSRPGVCDEEALIWALEEGYLGGAGLDETTEALRGSGKLWKYKDVCVTPEIGFFTKEAVERLTEISITNIERYVEGKPGNICLCE